MHRTKILILLGMLLTLSAGEARATLSATGFIPVPNRQLFYGISGASVPYTVTNTGTEDIQEIKIIIPTGFTYASLGAIRVAIKSNGFPQSKNWSASHSNGVLTLIPDGASDFLVNGECITAPIFVATGDRRQDPTIWNCVVTGTSAVTAQATDEVTDSMKVRIALLSLRGEAAVPALLPGATTTITAILLDDYNLPVPAVSVSFSVQQGDGVIFTTAPAPTDADGKTLVSYRASTAAGTDRIRLDYASKTTGYLTLEVIDPAPALVLDTLALNDRGVYYVKEQTPVALTARSGWSVEYRIDSDPWQNYAVPFTVGARTLGAHTLEYRHRDANGTTGSVNSVALQLSVLDSHQDILYNFPNPFAAGRQSTLFEYYLDVDSGVSLRIYDLFGQAVWSKDITAGEPGARAHDWNQIAWDGRNEAGTTVANGGYLGVLTINTTGTTHKRKIAVIK